jgi:hypothetical protein
MNSALSQIFSTGPKGWPNKAPGWIALGVVGGVLLYVIYRAGKVAVTQAAGLVTGNNAITQNQTDASGAPVTAYQGAGVAGTLGAAANSASGGVFASIGDWIGAHLPGNNYDPNSAQPTGVNRDQVVTPNYVPDIGELTGQAQQTWQ